MSSRKGKRSVEEDVEGPAKRKLTAKTADHDSGGGVVVCELSKNRKVSVRTWQGMVMVDIREYFEKDGKQLPRKKGISLSMDQWNILREHADDINLALQQKA